MKKIILVILLFSGSFAFALDWVSPIDKKYMERSPELFEKFDKAREILNSWGGQTEKLIAADNLLKDVLTNDPKYAPAHREYGRLYMMAGYLKNTSYKKDSLNLVEKSILQSISIEPSYADSFVLLGHVYTRMKKYSKAEEVLKKAENIGTKIPWLDLNWADLLNKQGRYQEAFERYKKVVKSKTTNKKAYSSALGGIIKYYQWLGDKEKTKKAHINKIKFNPMSAWSRGNYSSFLLFDYGDTDEAIKQGEKAIQIMDYGVGRYTLACALYTKWAVLSESPSDNNKAQKYFNRAVKLYPNIKEVIRRTSMYRTTRVTSQMLKKKLTK